MENTKTIMAKPTYISFRTTEEIRDLLKSLSEDGYRTLSQQCEMIIIEWLKEQGYLKETAKR